MVVSRILYHPSLVGSPGGCDYWARERHVSRVGSCDSFPLNHQSSYVHLKGQSEWRNEWLMSDCDEWLWSSSSSPSPLLLSSSSSSLSTRITVARYKGRFGFLCIYVYCDVWCSVVLLFLIIIIIQHHHLSFGCLETCNSCVASADASLGNEVCVVYRHHDQISPLNTSKHTTSSIGLYCME